MEGGAAAACQLASNDGDKSVDNDSEPEREPALAPRLPSNDGVQRFAAGVAVDQKNKSTTRSVDANGAAYDWNGKEWTPRSVFVATDDALNTILQRKATFDLGSSSVGEGRSKVGGEGGIRTLDELSTHTPLAGERLQPLGHLSNDAVAASPPTRGDEWDSISPRSLGHNWRPRYTTPALRNAPISASA